MQDNHEIEIDLMALLHEVIRKWWLIALCIILGGSAIMTMNRFVVTPRYQSQAILYVVATSTSVTSLADIQIGTALAEDYLFITQSIPVVDMAVDLIQSEGLDLTRGDIYSKLNVTSAGTRMIKITVTSTDPYEAQLIADAVATSAIVRIENVTQTDPPTTVELPEVSAYPIAPRVGTLIGALAGFVLALAIIAIRFILNDHIKSEDDVKKFLGLNTLVVIPQDKAS